MLHSLHNSDWHNMFDRNTLLDNTIDILWNKIDFYKCLKTDKNNLNRNMYYMKLLNDLQDSLKCSTFIGKHILVNIF